MFNLREAQINERLVIQEIQGLEQQIEYLKNVGIRVGREIMVVAEGSLPGSLLVQVGDVRLHLNRDAINRIMVEEKSKTLIKK